MEDNGRKWKKIATFVPLRIRIMVKFIGEYTSKVDDRGRLVFPAPLKGAMPPGSDLRFVIKKSLFAPCLEMYTYEEWDRKSEEVKSKLNFFNKEHALFWREYMRNRDVVEPDAKLGRISISRKLLDAIGVNKEVVFSGNDFMIEIWAKAQYACSEISEESYIAIADKLPENR